ncbi:hypothetical protein EYF80_037056 [Liparis tanakae]|uniref:Uncharacterized protein n=1 Tax=Liparis tanakae TaxID=230148 RepID=A0A4Z2GJ53_9TELE|nr:hypothetical protein EYF80_037056 [Liparis tanakae]
MEMKAKWPLPSQSRDPDSDGEKGSEWGGGGQRVTPVCTDTEGENGFREYAHKSCCGTSTVWV